MFRSGEYTSQYVTQLDGSKVPDKQIQPVGVELTVDTVYKVDGYTILKDDEYSKGERVEAPLNTDSYIMESDKRDHFDGLMRNLDPSEHNEDDLIHMEGEYYRLTEGPYVVQYSEKIQVPEDTVGYVLPRSRLIRSNNGLSTAVWDAGYEGRGEGGLSINSMTFLQKGMRIGVFVLADAKTNHQYDGSHQEENLNDA